MATTTRQATRARRPAPAKPAATFADVITRIRRPRRYAELVLDAEAAAEIEALAELLERMKARDEVMGGTPQAPDVARQLQAAEDRADSSRVRFVLEAISHRAYHELMKAYPASEDQRAEMERRGEEPWAFDPDAFAPVLVRAQLVDPEPGSDEEFGEFWDGLSDGQMRHLWATALAVQAQITQVGPRSVEAAEVLRTVTGS